ncbi:hypothetical protein SAMN04488066_105193 [Halorubrum aquaticum]|uniref:DUF8113 domain-containing protein n=1 Tax=Halorubrum aquaticum TaxID=387340 RepID=A0A1I3AG03_9EURY|nr:hypothetical protein [Halorubrum aquaticum]SFH49003.1 hypothetical protein SAMN04488066_105193 [Halorubrum aquaticum]
MSDDDPRSEGGDERDDDHERGDDHERDDERDEFAAELERARDLLDGDEIEAVHVGVVRDGEVDTTFAQRTADDPESEGLRALALLAAHVQLVADEAGVEASTVAGDAATLAGRVERIPANTEDLPEE